jgi:hypothetical protein
MPDLETRLARALREGDAADCVAREVQITVNDELALAASALSRIATSHVRHYEQLLEQHRAGVRGVRPEECEALLAVWRDARARIESGTPLDARGVHELEDALESGDYDHALTPAELAVVRRWRGFH